MYRSLVIYKKMFICLCREIYKCKREGLDVSWLGMNSGDPHVQGWNCNSLTEDFKMQKQFIHELKNYNENCFIQINLRLGKEHERGFEKLWDETIYVNSFSSNQRGLVVSLTFLTCKKYCNWEHFDGWLYVADLCCQKPSMSSEYPPSLPPFLTIF